MANLSNKNFPHAYGAGRCVASFSLSHPGGVEEESEDAPPLMMPPAFSTGGAPAGPQETKVFTSFDPTDPGSKGNAILTFIPTRQPYNATSFGVYVTGSGTAPLPYRDAYTPNVPPSVSARLNEVLPTTEIRPFKVVDETQLGSTHGQIVMNTRGGEGYFPTQFYESWYEVGLDWKIPPLKLTFAGEDDPTLEASFDSNWMARKVASVRDSLAGTLWATASYSDNSLSECHPDLDDNPIGGAFTPAGVSSTYYNSYLSTGPSMTNYREMPYGPTFGVIGSQYDEFNNGWIDPFEVTNFDQDIEAFYTPTVRPEVFLKTTFNRWTLEDISEDLSSRGPNFKGTLEMEFAPVVRIWVLWPSTELLGVSIPRPLLRFVSRPNAGEDNPGGQPPCVNVNVWQKNSSAVDGTIKPVYDLYSEWENLGND